MREGIAKLLADGSTLTSLERALDQLKAPTTTHAGCDAERCADRLARSLFEAPPDDTEACFERFETAFRSLSPPPKSDAIAEMFEAVRSLWVSSAAASHLPRAGREGRVLALAATKAHWVDRDLGTDHYTVDRYLERAWPKTKDGLLVNIGDRDTLAEIKDNIHRAAFTPAAVSQEDPAVLEQRLAGKLKKHKRRLVLLLHAGQDQGGPPEPRRLAELKGLFTSYPGTLMLLTTDPDQDALPSRVEPVEPRLDPAAERDAYLAESETCQYLKNFYERCCR